MEAEERTSLPTLSHPTTAAAQDPSSPDSNPQTPAEYSNYVPPANTDWTTSSTRRREYEEIDKARRGIRGLIRRVTPRFLLKNGRVGFHDGEDGEGSDAGTVRRFRMDVEDDDDSVVGGEGDNVVGGEGDSVVGGEGDSVAVGEEEEEEEGAKSAWWKSIGKKMMMKGKGKKEKSSSAEAGN